MAGQPGRSGGHNRKPTALKVLEGTDRPDRTNPDEPTPAAGMPRQPTWLPEKAKRYWPSISRTLKGMGVLTIADAAGLSLLVSALADFVEADEQVQANGLTYESHTVQGGYVIKANPAVAMRSDAWRRCFVILTQYGLTAASRGKVKAEKPPERDEFSEMFG